MPVSNKVIAGAGSAGTSMPLSVIIVWLIGASGLTVPPEVATAIGALVAAAASLLGGYIAPHQPAAVVAVVQEEPK